MKVILLGSIRGIGQAGDVKEVSDGYARNFLLPRHLARAATPSAAQEVGTITAQKREALALARVQAEELAEKLSGLTLELPRKANPKGTLFSAISPKEISEEVSAKAGIHISAHQISLGEHLKSIGEHPVTILLNDKITVPITVIISPQKK